MSFRGTEKPHLPGEPEACCNTFPFRVFRVFRGFNCFFSVNRSYVATDFLGHGIGQPKHHEPYGQTHSTHQPRIPSGPASGGRTQLGIGGHPSRARQRMPFGPGGIQNPSALRSTWSASGPRPQRARQPKVVGVCQRSLGASRAEIGDRSRSPRIAARGTAQTSTALPGSG